jgi:hypothetical protein
MSNDTALASAINLSQIAQHPNGSMAALVEVVQHQDRGIALLQENQAILFGLVARLKDKMGSEIQPMQKDRGEILRALITANGGKMFAKDCRKMMHLSESRFSELLSKMEDSIEKTPYHLNRSALVLSLK